MTDNHQAVELSAGGTLLDWSQGAPKILTLCMRRNLFELPKGHIEQGETAEAAAVRECREETGLRTNFKVTATLGGLTYTFQKSGINFTKHVRYFLLEPEDLDPVDLMSLSKINRKVHWLSQIEVVENEWVSDDLKSLLLNWLERLKATSR